MRTGYSDFDGRKRERLRRRERRLMRTLVAGMIVLAVGAVAFALWTRL